MWGNVYLRLRSHLGAVLSSITSPHRVGADIKHQRANLVWWTDNKQKQTEISINTVIQLDLLFTECCSYRLVLLS